MKESSYFSHDFNARSDRKLIKLQLKHGMIGIGIYWCIVEMLHEEAGYLQKEYDRIAFELRTDESVIQSIIEDFELFIIDDTQFYSESCLERIQKRMDISDKARENVNKRWDKKKRNTPVLQPNKVSNTIKGKERKEKEKKEKESKDSSLSENGNSLHKIAIDFYCDWYLKKVDVKYPFQGGRDGKAMKDILDHIRKAISERNKTKATDDEVMNGWEVVLNNYPKWEKFYQSKLKLSEIASNLPNIFANIKGIKHGKQRGSKNTGVSDSEIEAIAEYFYPDKKN